MLRSLYAWTMKEAAGPRAPYAMAAISFAESSFFPLPPDLLLIPMVATRPERAWRYAAICTVMSVLGGIAGYAIGYFLTDVGTFILRILGHGEGLEQFRRFFADWGLWVILIKGLTPFPYKVITIAAGLAAFSFPVFVAASVVTRGGRFFLVAWAVKRWGPAVMPMVERRLYTVGIVVVVLTVAAFLAVRLLG